MPLNFFTIASGSSGNSVYVATENTKILIDAGLSGKTIEQGLGTYGINCRDINAIFITHEHSDHIKGAGILSRRYDLPIYATSGTWSYMSRCSTVGRVAEKNKLTVKENVPVVLYDMEIKPFEIPHDANQPVGYSILSGRHKAVIATDLGHITQVVAENVYGADIMLIESNHDLDMLKNGRYPAVLKRRILGDRGHLSNVSCGLFIKDIFSEKTKHILLGHLSQENNLPTIAYETVKDILLAGKIDIGGAVELYLAERHRPGVMISLN